MTFLIIDYHVHHALERSVRDVEALDGYSGEMIGSMMIHV